MKPLSGLDAVFLYAETPHNPMSVIATVIVEGTLAFEEVVARIEARLPLLPPFRRRLVEMPFGLDHPVWVEDAGFDVREHVTRVSAPAPGDDRALERVVGRIARRRLDRARPLWEIAFVEGLCDERSALVIKAHHAALDGVSGAAMLLHLFDREGAAEPSDDWRPEAEPEPASLLGDGLSRLSGRPRAWKDALRHGLRGAAQITRSQLAHDAPLRNAAWPFQAPRSPFNGPLSARRSVAYARARLASVNRAREVFGGTINDVVLAACSHALRAELLERGPAPEGPLIAAIPVSTRSLEDEADCGNRISAFLTQLPVQHEDPIHQLAEVVRASRRGKHFHRALGDRTLAAFAEIAAPGLVRGAFQLYERWKLANSHAPLCNVLISNVPGPRESLHLLGRRVNALHPHGPLMEGTGLNITVMSLSLIHI